MKPQTVVVCVSDPRWTQSALHLACAFARNKGLEIALVQIIRVQHLAWLGTELGYQQYIEQNYDQLRSYELTAQDYGVAYAASVYQYYSSLCDAFLDIASQLHAIAIFATLPASPLTIWRKFQIRRLEHHLMKQQCQLFTLEKPAGALDWTPSVTAPVFRK